MSDSGVESVTESAMALASSVASSLVCGLSFQLPLMKGLRAMSKAVVEDEGETRLGAKADADDARRAAVIPKSFMIALIL